ncbi:MAG TPA: hypothetical protein VIS07_06835 [Candidatus Binatia bacterium]
MTRARRQPVDVAAALGLALALTGAFAVAGCGRVGPPRPPEYVIPKTADPVEVESAADGVKVTWRRPREYVDGEPLDDLARFVVLRACQPEATFQEIAVVPVTDQQRFRKASIFTLLDSDAPLGVSCRYQVIAMTFDEYASPPAESADIVRTIPGAIP